MLARPLPAQDAAPATAPAPAAGAEGTALIATITALKGVVQVRLADDQPWKPAAVGMELDEGAEFRTGPRSAVQFVIPPDQTITLDRLGTIKVLQAVKDSGKVTTALGMKYGRTRYDIQAADLEHDSTIRSPGSTLAIRGTDVTFEDTAPFAPNAVSREGRALFRTNRRQLVPFGGARRASVSAERNSTAETALVRTRTDPRSGFAGRSEAEKNLVLQLPSLGGRDLARAGLPGFRERARQDALLGGGGFLPPPPGPGPGPDPSPSPGPTPVPPPPPPAPTPTPTIVNDLLFDLVWNGAPFMDLDLEVARGGGEQALGGPLNATTPPPATSTGGQHIGNREADNTGLGREQVVWPDGAPQDFYLVRVVRQNSGPVNASVRVLTDTPGTNTVIRQFDNLTLTDSTGVFQVHVPFPADRTDNPPPLPPPSPSRFLPPPQPGPDGMSPSAAAPQAAAQQAASPRRARARDFPMTAVGARQRERSRR